MFRWDCDNLSSNSHSQGHLPWLWNLVSPQVGVRWEHLPLYEGYWHLIWWGCRRVLMLSEDRTRAEQCVWWPSSLRHGLCWVSYRLSASNLPFGTGWWMLQSVFQLDQLAWPLSRGSLRKPRRLEENRALPVCFRRPVSVSCLLPICILFISCEWTPAGFLTPAAAVLPLQQPGQFSGVFMLAGSA